MQVPKLCHYAELLQVLLEAIRDTDNMSVKEDV